MDTPQAQQPSDKPKDTQHDDTQHHDTFRDPSVKEIHHHHYHERRSGGVFRLFFGIFIILIGLSLLSTSFGWHWAISLDVWKLWPVVIILIGLSILSRGNVVMKIISIVLSCILFLFILAMLFWPGFSGNRSVNYRQTIDIGENPAAETTDIRLDIGATKLDLTGDAQKLVEGEYNSTFADLSITNTLKDTKQNVLLAMQKGVTWDFLSFGSGRQNLSLKLGNDIPVDLTINGGALDADVDTTEIPIKNININSGATTLDLALGDLVNQSNVSIDAGASTVRITLPKDVGARLKLEAGVSSKVLPDFVKIDDKTYETDSYATAEKKIDFDIHIGASSLSFSWN